ncbi:MAG: hypothetical protein ACOC41_00480 [Chitinivibrionales bacterium]
MQPVRCILVCTIMLLSNCLYRPALSSSNDTLSVPEVPDAIEPFYEGHEVWPFFKYHQSIDIEFDRQAARKLILRNHEYLMSDYRLLATYMRACLLDLMSNNRLLNTIENFRHDIIDGLQRWAPPAMMNSEVSSQFASFAGGDPWGRKRGVATRKELLPSEMWGLSVYSGRIMGKPLSLASFLLSVVRMYGASAQNVLLLENGMQTIGLFYTYPELYMIEGTSIRRIDNTSRRRISTNYYGFANDRYYYSGLFDLDSTILANDHSLLEQIKDITNIQPFKLDSPYVIDYLSRNDLPLRFGVLSEPELNYALHSLMVPDRSLYLDVSASGPLVEKMARKFDTTDGMLKWMEQNLRLGSVYRNYQERIMVGDQVLAYRFGTRKDQALLLASYLLRRGIEASVSVTQKDAYVNAQGRIFEISSYSPITSITDSVIIRLKR